MLGLLLAAVVLSACSTTGLSLVVDDRLTYLHPEDREAVTLPLTIEWRMEDFTVTRSGGSDGDGAGDEGFFAVFIDRTPQPPAEPLAWFARDDDACQRDPQCPDDEWFATRGIHTTTDTSFTIDLLPRPTDPDRRELHEVTVVLLAPDGVRIGESAWTVEFEVERTEQ